MKEGSVVRIALITACVHLVLAVPAADATTYHVAPDSSGDVLNIQAAIDAAASGDEIVLSDGIFTGDGNWDLNFGTKDLVLRSENGYEATFLDGAFDCMWVIDVHRAVTLDGGQTAATRIEGLTMQHFFVEGGVIRCVGTSPVIRACRLHLNRSSGQDPQPDGRDIVAETAALTIQDCVFEGDTCAPLWRNGVAVYARESWTTIEHCSFSHLEGTSAVDLDGGVLTDCSFLGIGGPGDGQGICLRVADGGQVSLERCIFTHYFGTGVRIEPLAQVFIGDCSFHNNMANDGAAVSTSGARTMIEKTTFLHNDSGWFGGIVRFGGTENVLTLDHCVFLDNKNTWVGGASGVSAYGGDVNVLHCTFVANRCTMPDYQGSAITISGGAHLLIENSIIAFGGQSGLPDGAVHCTDPFANVVVRCSDFFGNDGGDWTGCVAGMETINGNLSADPLFCDVPGDDLMLRTDSPCGPGSTGSCGLIGALGALCGPLAVEPHSWGSIKALYR